MRRVLVLTVAVVVVTLLAAGSAVGIAYWAMAGGSWLETPTPSMGLYALPYLNRWCSQRVPVGWARRCGSARQVSHGQ